MASPVAKLQSAIDDFHKEVAGDPDYRYVSAGLRDVQADIARLPAGLADSDTEGEDAGDGDPKPKSFRDARKDVEKELADDNDGEKKNDRSSNDTEPGKGDGDGAEPKEGE